jgi:hypothetical protein
MKLQKQYRSIEETIKYVTDGYGDLEVREQIEGLAKTIATEIREARLGLGDIEEDPYGDVLTCRVDAIAHFIADRMLGLSRFELVCCLDVLEVERLYQMQAQGNA